MRAESAAYISCGTWGLVGVELEQPVTTDAAREANFTNEGGVDGRVRFLHNVMGLWLLSESVRQWEREGETVELSELLAAAASVTSPVSIFDANDPRFLAPGDLPGRIAEWCTEHGVAAPATRAEFARSIIESLAEAFAGAVRTASILSGVDVETIHIVGGGALNELLCQRTADRAGLPVLAGPVEATAIGNVLVQARAQGVRRPRPRVAACARRRHVRARSLRTADGRYPRIGDPMSQITFFAPDTDAYVSSVMKHVPEYEQLTGDTVRLRIIDSDTYFSNDIHAQLGEPDGADVFMSGPVLAWEHLAAGFVEPLDDYVARARDEYDFSDFLPNLIVPNTWSGAFGTPLGEGPLLGIPVNCESYNLAYDRGRLETLGLDVPRTWTEYFDAARRIARSGAQRGFAQRGEQVWHTMYTGFASQFWSEGAAISMPMAAVRSRPRSPCRRRPGSSMRCTTPGLETGPISVGTSSRWTSVRATTASSSTPITTSRSSRTRRDPRWRAESATRCRLPVPAVRSRRASGPGRSS